MIASYESTLARALLDLQDYAAFLIDLDGRVTSWNARVQEVLGFTEREWLGHALSSLS
jgi:PAS domain S-box-containing protein